MQFGSEMKTISIITTRNIGSTMPMGNMSIDLPLRRVAENAMTAEKNSLDSGHEKEACYLKEEIYPAFLNGNKFSEEKL